MCFRAYKNNLPVPDQPIPVRRGDVIVVGRIIDWRTWIRKPLSASISWKIQQSTNSPWNHVACYIGNGKVAEAEWNKGVRVSEIREYLTGEYRVAVVKPPESVNRDDACETWSGIASESKGRCSYSIRTLILMRVAALLFGADGIRDVVRNNPRDGAWICSEVGTFGWSHSGLRGAEERLITPADFLDARNGLQLDLTQIVAASPSSIQLEN